MSSGLSGISALIQNQGAMAQSQVQEAAQMAMLKKSIDIQAQGVLPLINSLVQNSPAASNPSNLGNAIDVRA
ncbi:MAG: YjfB family protein [Halothiobacillus sp.]